MTNTPSVPAAPSRSRLVQSRLARRLGLGVFLILATAATAFGVYEGLTGTASGRWLMVERLLDRLAAVDSEHEARRLEGQVLGIMSYSNNLSVRQMMRSANEAIAVGDLRHAERDLDAVLFLEPDNAAASNRRAIVRYLKGDLLGALNDINRTLVLQPRHFVALAGRVAILHQTGRAAEAAWSVHRIREVHPHFDGGVWARLAGVGPIGQPI